MKKMLAIIGLVLTAVLSSYGNPWFYGSGVKAADRVKWDNKQGQIYTPERDFTYSTNAWTITITGYTGTNTDVNIPPKINGLPVTTIGTNAFLELPVTSVTAISITTIGNYAFDGCQSLALVDLPSVITIGDYAFWSSAVQSLLLKKVTSLGPASLSLCTSLNSVYFYEDAPALGVDVFTDSPNVTNYYLSGMTGFGTNFGGRPTAIWGPRVPHTIIHNNTTNTVDQWGVLTIP